MKDNKIMYKISQGMYVLTTKGGGCIVDAVSQISGGDNPLVAVAVMKKNYTDELMKNGDRFALSVIGLNNDPQVIKTFGFQSMRDADKFAQCETTGDDVKIIKDSLGYMLCEKIDAIDNDTHTLFIGRVVDGDIFADGEPMTYAYYQAHKDELLKTKTEQGKTAWVCTICGYVYYGDELPQDYACPICGVDATLFAKR